MSDLPSFAAGDPIRATDLQALADAIAAMQAAADGGGATQMAEADFPSDPFDKVFIGEATGNVSSGLFKWKEKTNVAGTIVDFGTPGTDGRNCTASAHASAALPIAEKQFFLTEIADGTDHRYIVLPNPTFLVYLTQNGGANGDDGSTTTKAFPTYTYDVFLDSAKTIKLASTVGVLFHREQEIAVTAASHGLAQWNGTTLILIKADEYFDDDTCDDGE